METNHAQDQAKAQYECIAEMVERLECSQACTCHTYENYRIDPDFCDSSVTFDTEEEFDNYHNEDDARQAIHDDPLSVQVRSDWYSVGDEDGGDPAEFEILLCTGGPAVRIRGELSDNQPDRAWIEYQDWGTSWTRYFDAEQDTLLAYAREFYFGE